MKIVQGEVFAGLVDVTEPTTFLGCQFYAGVWFRTASRGSKILDSVLNNSDPKGTLVRCEPESFADVSHCTFNGSAYLGVLVSGGLRVADCTFLGVYSDNAIQAEGWGGGVVERCLFREVETTLAKNAIVNARHAGQSDNPGVFHLHGCTIIGRRCVIVGAAASRVVLTANDVKASMSPKSGEEYYAYSAWGAALFPVYTAGNRFSGEVRLGGVIADPAKTVELPLPRVLAKDRKPWTAPGYGCSQEWHTALS